MSTQRQIVLSLFEAAVAAADPFAPTLAALSERLGARTDDGRGWIISTGKAAARMAAAAMQAAQGTDLEIAGGIVVCNESCDVAPLECLVGDHPFPGVRSLHAATRIGALVGAVHPRDHVMVLVSGGTSSLIAAPIDDADIDTTFATMRELVGSGRDIHAMNTVRRTLLRWAGGRLAEALAPARVHQVLLSDVIGDDPAIIGSGPCVPDAGVRFEHVGLPVVLGRTMIHDALIDRARSDGTVFHLHEDPLGGEARHCGDEIARWLATDAPSGVHCWTGETTVALGSTRALGGRCQEFALSAAIALDDLRAERVTLLAAGTDGRDGPTDAAGAVVDAWSASRLRSAGFDPGALLDGHESYRALELAEALLKTGPTGTNVADVVLAAVR